VSTAGSRLQLDPSAQPDVNAPVELTGPLRASGDRRLAERLHAASGLPNPEGNPTDLIQRLWAVVVVVALLASAFVAWRLLRPRSSTPADERVYPCLKETAWAGLGPTVRRPLADVDGAE
jgi:hypothetical protein